MTLEHFNEVRRTEGWDGPLEERKIPVACVLNAALGNSDVEAGAVHELFDVMTGEAEPDHTSLAA